MADPFVVIGGDAAGLSAASKCRREDPDRTVIVLERGRWVSYAYCGMPYYVKGEVAELTDLLSLTPADVADRGIDLRRSHEVVSIDPEDSTVTVESPSETYNQSYGDLLIATGASATTGPFDRTREGVFTMHHMDSAAALRAALTPPAAIDPEAVDGPYVDRERVRRNAALEPPETAAVIGGGYVGVEMAEGLSAWDVSVHLFQRPERLLPPFGKAAGDRVERHLSAQGVQIHTGTAVEAIQGGDRVRRVVHDDGTLDVDLAVVGIGVTPNTDLLAGTAVTTGPQGSVSVDRYGETDVPHVYAAGDCTEDTHVVTGEPTWSPLGLTANRAGRAIGATVGGDPTPVGETAETALVKAMELGAGRTGVLDHERARDAGFDPVTETITAGSRSGYYPGAAETTVMLTADRSSRLVLGAATVGTDRAAKRIDTVASALAGGLTVGELERVDAGYAPPFSPVWDPVLTAAKVLNGSMPSPASGDPK